MKVMKFGGTSVGKPQRMHEVATIVTAIGSRRIVVLSAVSGTTNALVEIGNLLAAGHKEGAREKIQLLEASYHQFVSELVITPEAIERARRILIEHFEFLYIILRISYSEALSKDILAQGELLSTKLFSVYLEEKQVPHALISALDFMRIDANEEPQVDVIRTNLTRVLAEYPGVDLFVTQGFICRNAKGEVDNLKRGGSDYSASLIAAAVSATVCEIWTDISGMHNNDPRVVKQTRAISKLSFDEAAELAYFGAKILHPASIWPARQYNVPVRLLNTMEPENEGTFIARDAESEGVKAVAAKDGITAINIRSSRMLLAYGFLRRVFEVFEKYKTSIDMITTSEVAVSLTIDNASALPEICRELEIFSTVSVDTGQAIVCIVGNRVAAKPDTLRKLFESLQTIPVRMISYGGSEHNISVLVDAVEKKNVLTRLNADLFGLD